MTQDVKFDAGTPGHTEVAGPESLGAFCDLRMAAWRHRDLGLARDTVSDPIIARHHFTNVYRELDPGTMLAERMLVGLQPRDAVWRSVAYRLTNRREVWQAFHDDAPPVDDVHRYPMPQDADLWLDFLKKRMAAGERVFTGRHLTMGMKRYEKTLAAMAAWTPDLLLGRPREFFQNVRTLPGVGTFFAWQVTADLMMAGHLETDPDFVVLGPGARFALRWILDERPFGEVFNAVGRRVVMAGTGHMNDTTSHREIKHLRDTQDEWLPPTWAPWDDRPLSLVDLEHALCEYGRWGVLHARTMLKPRWARRTTNLARKAGTR